MSENLTNGAPEMAQDTNQDLAVLLNTDLTSVDRSTPLIKPGVYDVVIKTMEVKDGKKPDAKNLNISLALAQGAETQDGKTVNPGFMLFDLVSLTKTEKYNPAERLADIQLAAFGEQRPGFRIMDYIGKTVQVSVKIEDADEEAGYPAKNRVSRYRVKKAAGGLSAL